MSAALRQGRIASMDFSLTEDQVMIRDAAQSYLADNCQSEAVRAAMASESGFDPQIWQAVAAELGWCSVAIDEAHGGMGLGAVELVLIQEQAGYHLLCSPFFSTVCLAATVLQSVGSDEAKARYLPQIAEGSLQASVMMPYADSLWSETALTADYNGDEWTVSGTVTRIPDAHDGALMLLLANTDEGMGLFAVTAGQDGVTTQSLDGWDAGRRFFSAELSGAKAVRCDDGVTREAMLQAASLIRLYIAAEQLGAAQRCLDLTVAYVQERKQFGRVIGSFQAIKHRCAQMMIEVEALRSAVYGAAALAAGEHEPQALMMECASAKALASEALLFCAGESIQLHGGVGFTAEYDPQLYFKRAQASKHWFGTPESLRAEIAGALL